jgi:vitamin K-dependent gamma-carboxylase-like protein
MSPESTYKKAILATDFQALSVFRIFFSVYLLWDYVIEVAPYFQEFYGDRGILPLSALAADTRHWAPSIMARVLEATKIPFVLPILYPLALVAFGIGYRTRLFTGVAFVFNSYLFWRNPYINSGAQDLARLLLLWCLFLPMNRYWSVDAALDPLPRDRHYSALPFLAVRLQISSLYFFAALFKLAGPSWLDGSAISLALTDNVFGGTPVGLYLVAHHSRLLAFATYATIAFQLTMPFMVYSPWYNFYTRSFALAGLALMHLSFILCLNIGGFPYLCLIMLILLTPDTWWNFILSGRRARLARVQIFYEPGCDFCHRVSLLLRECLLSPTTQVLPANVDAEANELLTANNSWVVRGVDGDVYLKWRAMAYLLKQNPLSAPFGYLTELAPVSAPMARFYDFIGANRKRLGRAARFFFPSRSGGQLGMPAQALCGMLMWLALICNIWTVRWSALPWSAGVQSSAPTNVIPPLFDLLQIGQKWDLFAPTPIHLQRHYRVRAQMTDGSSFDLMERLPVPLVRDDGFRNIFASHRWLKYFDRLSDLTEGEWAAFGQFLCGQARDYLAPALKSVEIARFKQSPDELWNPDLTPTEIHVHECSFNTNASTLGFPRSRFQISVSS